MGERNAGLPCRRGGFGRAGRKMERDRSWNAIHVHLPHVGMAQTTQLQVDDDQTAQLAVVEQQIHPVPGLVNAQSSLPPDKSESFAQFKQKVLQPLGERGLKIGL